MQIPIDTVYDTYKNREFLLEVIDYSALPLFDTNMILICRSRPIEEAKTFFQICFLVVIVRVSTATDTVN